MNKENSEKLALALEALSKQISSSPRSVIGNQVNVSAGPGSSGHVIGQKIQASGNRGGGTVIGSQVNVSAGADPAAPLVSELLEAATAVRDDKAARPWITSLVDRVKGLSDRAIDATIVAGVEAAIRTVFT